MILKETVMVLLTVYKSTKSIVHSPDCNMGSFDNVTEVLQGDTLTPYLFIICLDYVLKASKDVRKENSLT